MLFFHPVMSHLLPFNLFSCRMFFWTLFYSLFEMLLFPFLLIYVNDTIFQSALHQLPIHKPMTAAAMLAASMTTRSNIGFSDLLKDTSKYGLWGPGITPATSGKGTTSLPPSHSCPCRVMSSDSQQKYLCENIEILRASQQESARCSLLCSPVYTCPPTGQMFVELNH